jgi:hypothetical protein
MLVSGRVELGLPDLWPCGILCVSFGKGWILIMSIRQEQIDRAVELARAYGATRLILFGRAVTEPEQARDLDLACDGVPGWKLYELGAQIEEELRIPLDLVPLNPPNSFTRLIEKRGTVLL